MITKIMTKARRGCSRRNAPTGQLQNWMPHNERIRIIRGMGKGCCVRRPRSPVMRRARLFAGHSRLVSREDNKPRRRTHRHLSASSTASRPKHNTCVFPDPSLIPSSTTWAAPVNPELFDRGGSRRIFDCGCENPAWLLMAAAAGRDGSTSGKGTVGTHTETTWP